MIVWINMTVYQCPFKGLCAKKYIIMEHQVRPFFVNFFKIYRNFISRVLFTNLLVFIHNEIELLILSN